MNWSRLAVLVFALVCGTCRSAEAEDGVESCAHGGELRWSERFAVSQIRARQPVALRDLGPEPAPEARAHVCLQIGAAGEVKAVKAMYGDAVFVRTIQQSLLEWRFQAPARDGVGLGGVMTELTFVWRDHIGELTLSDRTCYPISESVAGELVRAVPGVATLLKPNSTRILEIDGYPENRDGVFYLFHLYEGSSEMTRTLGWYFVNAYSGEVWDGLHSEPVHSVALNRLRAKLAQRHPLGGTTARGYEGVDPWSPNAGERIESPCVERPLERHYP